MEPKYHKGYRVIVISVQDQHKKPKYPEIEKYVSDTGTVVDSYWIGLKKADVSRDNYVYTVRMDNRGREIAVAEDALTHYID
jgi:hypothetical protein